MSNQFAFVKDVMGALKCYDAEQIIDDCSEIDQLCYRQLRAIHDCNGDYDQLMTTMQNECQPCIVECDKLMNSFWIRLYKKLKK